MIEIGIKIELNWIKKLNGLSIRSDYGRMKLCNSLCELGYHIFAIDYRGYGDSSGTPSEVGVVNDVLALYKFIKSYQNQSRIFFWGHSLGTGFEIN